jgi:hypothetical protein
MLSLFLILPFFFAGVIAFLICATLRPLRRFAFSSALWFVALLPAVFGSLLLLGLGKAATEQMVSSRSLFIQPLLKLVQSRVVGNIATVVTVLLVIAFASIVAILHQTLIHRITFALFRIYVAGVGFGIGLLIWLLILVGIGSAGIEISHTATAFLLLMLTLAAGTSFLCYRYAQSFRGTYQRNLPVVSPEEFGPGAT